MYINMIRLTRISLVVIGIYWFIGLAIKYDSRAYILYFQYDIKDAIILIWLFLKKIN
jgi:hypothetical protein